MTDRQALSAIQGSWRPWLLHPLLLLLWLGSFLLAAALEHAPHASLWFPPAAVTFAGLFSVGWRAVPAVFVACVLGTWLTESGNTEGDRKRRGDISSVEAVIGRGSPLIGQTTSELSLVHTYGVNLLAVSRQGKRIRERLGQLTLRSGDVVVLQGLRQ